LIRWWRARKSLTQRDPKPDPSLTVDDDDREM
jgi:hypothetical protein